MGRMKHGKPQPHANKKKVIPRKNETNRQMTSSDVETPAETSHDQFGKRKLDTSQAERYRELPDAENSDEEAEDYDETKDLDYVKKHYGGSTSHFQFKDEKEWNQEIEKEEGNKYMELDLVRLANHMSSLCTYEKLLLNDMDSDAVYCIEELKDAYDLSKDSSTNSHKPSIDKHSQNNVTAMPTWDFTGVEKYRDKLMENSSRTQRSLLQAHVSGKNQEINSSVIANTSSSNKNDDPITEGIEMQSHEPSHLAYNNNSTEKACFPPSGVNSGIIANSTSDSIPGNPVNEEELDLDALLEIPSPMQHTIPEGKKDTHDKVGVENNKTREVEELDDWLDSILD